MPKSKHQFQCEFCEKIISSSALMNHLKFKHSSEFESLVKSFEFIKNEIRICVCGQTLQLPKNWINVAIYSKYSNEPVEKLLNKVCGQRCKKLIKPWNFGETKETNLSIAKYAKSRMGLNNPIHTWLHIEEKVASWKEKISLISKGRNLGLTLEEIHGNNDAILIKAKQSSSAKIRKIHGHTGKKHSKETKEFLSQCTAKRLSRMQTKVSNPQRKLFERLQKELGEDVLLEQNYKYYVIDIVYKTFAIEVDGDFYHANISQGFEPKYPIQKNNLRNDKAKTTFLTNRGWTVIRVWEHDINTDIESVVTSLKEKIAND